MTLIFPVSLKFKPSTEDGMRDVGGWAGDTWCRPGAPSKAGGPRSVRVCRSLEGKGQRPGLAANHFVDTVSFGGSSTPSIFRVQVRDGGLIVVSCPGVFSSGTRSRRLRWQWSLDPLIDILPEPSPRPTRRAVIVQAPAGGGGLRRKLVFDEGWREAQLKLDTQPTAGGRTLVDADRIKAARIGDPRWRRSDRAHLPTADQAIHASDGSSQGSTCQRAVSFNLFFSL
ncbi:hypothetical protein EVAR_23944_1 [Eumeta japonica]|uniref:Uncharacterized protein n=1 Tax=Eumeta variegata TaxID=151549 RepID=A0A4C1V188_EUMVA|nr:hypothetical protein EVAR_23944_1 [Eumeta japonica]